MAQEITKEDIAAVFPTVADTSQMWVVLNVRLEDMKYLRVRETKTGRSRPHPATAH
jgi:hypothetical protein